MRYFAVLVILLFFKSSVFGNGEVGESSIAPSLNKQRASNAFYQSIYFQKLSASRFLPLFNITGAGSWSSPRTIVLLDGIPFTGFPYGMSSIDLVPVDLVTVDSITAKTSTGVLLSGPASGGAIDIVRSPIPDTLAIDVRLFTGSETGDPLIYIFTRPERSHINKNKVGPSFALSIANTRERWAYRISGGGFFYFSTGSVNDHIMGTYNPALMGRQNRQVKVIGEAVYTIDNYRILQVYAGGINLFGWEMSPFTSLFNHFTNVSTTGRIQYADTASGYSVTIVRDESYVWTKEMVNALPGSIRNTEWLLHPSYELPVNENMKLSVSTNLSLVNIKDIDSGEPGKQPMLMQEVSPFNWGIGVELDYQRGAGFYSAGVRADSYFDDPPELSGELSAEFRFHPVRSFHTTISSTVYSPGYLERYGTFVSTVSIDEPVDNREFRISGNPDLNNERIHEVNFGFSQSSEKSSLRMELFGRWTENQILQRTERSFRPGETGEILKTATYTNSGSRFVPGATIQLNINPFGFLSITSEHQYIDNSDLRSLPRYKNVNIFEFMLPLSVALDISVMHIGRTFWREFVLAPEDDAWAGMGSDGTIQSATVFDIAVSRRFETFYFTKGLEVSVQAQNLFNEPFRRIAVGNFIDRAVFIYVSFGL